MEIDDQRKATEAAEEKKNSMRKETGGTGEGTNGEG